MTDVKLIPKYNMPSVLDAIAREFRPWCVENLT